jgi:4-amino-4-deoxy-L-arabinose transferase-like glycosyltransferase
MGKKSKNKPAQKVETKVSRFVTPRTFDAFVMLCLLAVALIWWWPHRYLPFWWDSAGFVINAANDLLRTNFNPPIALHSDFAHPPLLMMLVAGSWKVFGANPLAAHLTTLPFLVLLLISTYFLAKKLVSPATAALASMLVASVPIVLHETSQIYLDLPTAALTTLSLALLLNKKLAWAAIALSLAALTKETALFVLPLFALLALDQMSVKDKSKKIVTLVALSAPALAYLAYVVVFNQFTGHWFSTRSGRLADKFSYTLTTLTTSLQNVASSFFVENGMWIMSIIALGSLVVLWRKKALTLKSNKLLWGFLLTAIGVLVAFALFQEYTLRYSLMILPLWFVSALKLLELASQKSAPKQASSIIVGASALALLVLALNWYPQTETTSSYSFSPPTNLTVLDRIFVFRQAAKFVELTHQSKQILGSFPENQQLTQAYLGFVDQGLPFALCNQSVSQEVSESRLLLFHPYSPGQIECKKMLDANQATLLKRFERNGSWVEVFELTEKMPSSPDLTN